MRDQGALTIDPLSTLVAQAVTSALTPAHRGKLVFHLLQLGSS
jgi:hypothetical protein